MLQFHQQREMSDGATIYGVFLYTLSWYHRTEYRGEPGASDGAGNWHGDSQFVSPGASARRRHGSVFNYNGVPVQRKLSDLAMGGIGFADGMGTDVTNPRIPNERRIDGHVQSDLRHPVNRPSFAFANDSNLYTRPVSFLGRQIEYKESVDT